MFDSHNGQSQIGVLVVILTLATRQAELRSTRPVGDKNQIAAQPDQNVDYSARLWDDPLAQLSTFQIASQGQLDAARKSLSQTIDGAELGARLLVLQAIRPQLLASIFFTTDLDALFLETVGARYHQVAGELWSDCSSALQDQHLRK
jgi:hypothetical protein